MKYPITPAGIEPATFGFVVQHFNHCATAVPFQETFMYWKRKVAHRRRFSKYISSTYFKCIEPRAVTWQRAVLKRMFNLQLAPIKLSY